MKGTYILRYADWCDDHKKHGGTLLNGGFRENRDYLKREDVTLKAIGSSYEVIHPLEDYNLTLSAKFFKQFMMSVIKEEKFNKQIHSIVNE